MQAQRRRCRHARPRLPRRLLTEPLESRRVLASLVIGPGDDLLDSAAGVMQNPANVHDVNDDGHTSPLDALLVINRLSSEPSDDDRRPAGPMFYDVNGDAFITPLDALLILNVLNAEGEGPSVVQFRLSVSDDQGTPIDKIKLGKPFQVDVFVQDLTARQDGGVLSAFTDLIYSQETVSVLDNVEHGADYGVAASGDTSIEGMIDEVGSMSGSRDPLGPDERLLFSVTMTAISEGPASFELRAAGDPAHNVVLYGVPDDVPDPPRVPSDQVDFDSLAVEVVINLPPIAYADRYNGTVDTVLSVDANQGVLANDVEPQGGPIVANLVDGPFDGSLDLNPDGSFEYTPNPGALTDRFIYSAHNVGQSSNRATVDIVLGPVSARGSAIHGIAYDDASGNGQFDADRDAVMGGVEVTLMGDVDGDGFNDELTTITDPLTGEYGFPAADHSLSDLYPGDYTLMPSVVEGTVATTPDPIEISLQPGETHVAFDGQTDDLPPDANIVVDPSLAHGRFRLIDVAGRKFNDRDANGIKNAGEPGLSAWRIELEVVSPDGSTFSGSTSTDADGRYRFEDVGPGVISIRETPRQDWYQTSPADDGTYRWQAVSGENVLDRDFGNYLSVYTGAVAGSGNLDGSGPADLIVVNDYNSPPEHRSSLTLLSDLGSDTGLQRREIELPARTRPTSVFVGDLDGDGLDDLVVASLGDPLDPTELTNSLQLYTNAGGGDFHATGQLALSCDSFEVTPVMDRCDGPIHVTGGRVQGGTAVDLLVTANFRSDTVSIINLDRDSPELAFRVEHLRVGSAPLAVSLGHINDDATIDLAVANYGSGSLSLFVGAGDGTFAAHGTLVGLQSPADLLLIDLDGDGGDELVVTEYAAGELTVFRNQGSGNFDLGTGYMVGEGPQSIAAEDLNGDDFTDLAIANGESGTVSVLLGRGNGAFADRIDFGLPPIPEINRGPGQSPQVILAADLDGRGRMDLAVAHFLGGVSIHMNGVDDRSRSGGSLPAVSAMSVETTSHHQRQHANGLTGVAVDRVFSDVSHQLASLARREAPNGLEELSISGQLETSPRNLPILTGADDALAAMF